MSTLERAETIRSAYVTSDGSVVLSCVPDPPTSAAQPGHAPRLDISQTGARQGRRGRRMLRVLAISMALAIAGVFGLWWLHMGPMAEVAHAAHASRAAAAKTFVMQPPPGR